MSARRLAVIGAGPVGLAAALGAVKRGLAVAVYEAQEVGAALREWGPVRFFSPLAMNLPPGAVEWLGDTLPAADAILTGPEFVDRVLLPLANSAALQGKIRTGSRVISVARAGLTRSDYAGHPIRAERSFRLLIETAGGEEIAEADAVIDASGVYGQPVKLSVPGERAAAPRLMRTLGALHARLGSLKGKRVLLAGHGHSAANALLQLADAGPQVIWAVRSLNRRPCGEVACDPLPERRSIVARANDLAAQPPAWLAVERRATIQALTPRAAGFEVTLSGARSVVVDEIVALTGYRPDLSFLSELALEIHPATEGAGKLSRALANVTDCLALPTLSPTDLDSGEPGFYLAGAKSYGRARTFLLESGYKQIETMLDSLAQPLR